MGEEGGEGEVKEGGRRRRRGEDGRRGRRKRGIRRETKREREK